MRNTTATRSSTPLMTITSPTPFRGTSRLKANDSGNRARGILAGRVRHPPRAQPTDQAGASPDGEESSLSPSGSRGGPAGASLPASRSSTSGGGAALNGDGARPGTPETGGGGPLGAGGASGVGALVGAAAGGPGGAAAGGGAGGAAAAGGTGIGAPESAAPAGADGAAVDPGGRVGAAVPRESRSRSWPSR